MLAFCNVRIRTNLVSVEFWLHVNRTTTKHVSNSRYVWILIICFEIGLWGLQMEMAPEFLLRKSLPPDTFDLLSAHFYSLQCCWKSQTLPKIFYSNGKIKSIRRSELWMSPWYSYLSPELWVWICEWSVACFVLKNGRVCIILLIFMR